MKKEIFTAMEVTGILGVSLPTINRWLNSGELKGFRPSKNANWKVTRKELVRYMKEYDIPSEFLKDDKIRILVVDDEEVITSLISKALEKDNNLEIDVANSGFKAGVKLTEFKPDIVILDIILGDMDGREFFKYINEDPELNGIKVIGISGKIIPSEEQSLLDMGFNAFIRKPFKINKLKDTIFELIKD